MTENTNENFIRHELLNVEATAAELTEQLRSVEGGIRCVAMAES